VLHALEQIDAVIHANADAQGDHRQRVHLHADAQPGHHGIAQYRHQGKRQDDAFRQGAIDGAYWLRPPGPNCEVVIAYQGAIAPEAIKAAGALSEARRDIGVLAVTSADRLNAGWTAAQRARSRGNAAALSHVERLLQGLPPHCTLVTVIDGHPATLAWLGGVQGHRTVSLGVEHFGQTGTIGDLYRHFGIDAATIVDRAKGLTHGAR
jgi:pyruvate dehydrogenase E1 component